MTLSALARAAFSGLPRSYWVLWTAILVNKLGAFVVPYLYLYLTRSEQMSVAHASLVVALYGMGSTCAGPVGGLLADRIGRRATLMISLIAGAIAMLALGLVHRPVAIPMLALTLGFTSELHRPAASAMIADLVAADHRVRAYSLLHWAINLGFVVALLVAGVMATRSYLLLFVGDAATMLLCAIIVWRWIPESRRARAEPASAPVTTPVTTPAAGRTPLRAGLFAPLRDRRFAAIWLLALLTAMIYFQFSTTLPEALARHGVTTAEYGTLIAITCVVVAIGQPLAAPLIGGLRKSQVLAASCLLVAAGFGSLTVVETLPLFLAAAVIWTLGEIGFVAVQPAIIDDLSPPALRGGYQGCYQMAWGLASFAGPALGGLVFQHHGAWLWAGCFVLGVALAVGHYLVVRGIERAAAPAAPAWRARSADNP